jgi:hypothetical protein
LAQRSSRSFYDLERFDYFIFVVDVYNRSRKSISYSDVQIVLPYCYLFVVPDYYYLWSIFSMKPGYYIDGAKDIAIVYPDGTVDLYTLYWENGSITRGYQNFRPEQMINFIVEHMEFIAPL